MKSIKKVSFQDSCLFKTISQRVNATHKKISKICSTAQTPCWRTSTHLNIHTQMTINRMTQKYLSSRCQPQNCSDWHRAASQPPSPGRPTGMLSMQLPFAACSCTTAHYVMRQCMAGMHGVSSVITHSGFPFPSIKKNDTKEVETKKGKTTGDRKWWWQPA